MALHSQNRRTLWGMRNEILFEFHDTYKRWPGKRAGIRTSRRYEQISVSRERGQTTCTYGMPHGASPSCSHILHLYGHHRCCKSPPHKPSPRLTAHIGRQHTITRHIWNAKPRRRPPSSFNARCPASRRRTPEDSRRNVRRVVFDCDGLLRRRLRGRRGAWSS